MFFLDTQVSLAPTHVWQSDSPLVRPSVGDTFETAYLSSPLSNRFWCFPVPHLVLQFLVLVELLQWRRTRTRTLKNQGVGGNALNY